jgi:hypothetical protein
MAVAPTVDEELQFFLYGTLTSFTKPEGVTNNIFLQIAEDLIKTVGYVNKLVDSQSIDKGNATRANTTRANLGMQQKIT